MRIINLQLNKGTFPDRVNIATVSPIFKNSEKGLISKSGPTSALPRFQKILERIMVVFVLTLLKKR